MIKKTKGFAVLALFITMILTFISCNKKVKPFIEGDQRFIIKNYNLQQEGLLGLENILREHVEMPNLLSVEKFNANISEEGVIV